MTINDKQIADLEIEVGAHGDHEQVIADAMSAHTETWTFAQILQTAIEGYTPEDREQLSNPDALVPYCRERVLGLWGKIEDYYPDYECTETRRAEWEASKLRWREQIELALNAASRGARNEAIAQASHIEREWGDDPATRKIAYALKD